MSWAFFPVIFKCFTLILIIFRYIWVLFTCQSRFLVFLILTEGNYVNNYKTFPIFCLFVCFDLGFKDTLPFCENIYIYWFDKQMLFNTINMLWLFEKKKNHKTKEKKNNPDFSTASFCEQRRARRGKRYLSSLPSVVYFNLWITLGISCNILKLITLFIKLFTFIICLNEIKWIWPVYCLQLCHWRYFIMRPKV